MNASSRSNLTMPRLVRSLALPGILAGLLTLTACSKGSSDQDSIRIGSGQTTSSGTVNGVDYPIFYVKRVTPDFTAPNTDDDVRHLRVYSTNADLYMRDRASPSATEHNITARVHPDNELWDVKDVDVSPDGKKVIFAMRGPISENMRDDKAPTWNIWEYVIASDDLHRIISSDTTAEDGQDVSPHYLPDGHILFSSTRQPQSKAILLDEGKGQFEAQDENRDESAFVLHVMAADGTGIQQVSYNQSHDMDATVLSNGRILFSRWDHASGRDGIHFYTAKPNGTDTQLLYGSASHAAIANTAADGSTITYPTVQYSKAHEMMDGRILTLVRPFSGTELGGDLYIIDTNNFVENNQTLAGNTTSGNASTKATPFNVQLVTGPSIGGRFASAVPYWDGTGRILMSWTLCRVIDPTTQVAVNCTSTNVADTTFTAAAPIYSLWVLNPSDGTQLPIVAPTIGVMITDVVIAQPRTTAPTALPFTLDADPNIDTSLKNEGVGILDIRSVYDFDGSVFAAGAAGCTITSNANPDPTNACYTNRPARFLRIEKAVSLPSRKVYDFDTNAFGPTGFMREILGYIPIEPDGSVRVKIPGNVAFQISVTDANGRAVNNFPRHNAWLSLRPGETVQCNGCHRNSTNVPAGQSGLSHGRSGSFASVYAGAVGATFANTNSTFAAVVTGQTMAQARATWSCSFEQCASITPSVNVAFANVWPSTTTDSKVVPTTITATARGDFSLVYAGTGGLTTKVPTNNSTCLTVWSSTCRITINYLEHIQPIWERTALTTSALPGACVSCHTTNGSTQVPAGQLELTADDLGDGNIQVNSYRELLFTDNQMTLLNGTTLQDVCLVPAVDANGNPTTVCQTFATVLPVLNARNAAGSRFFNTFSTNRCMKSNGIIGDCSVNHTGGLTEGELRLISEWVDIGAQYYNDPFKAPVN
jgi:hypothetical protein